MDPETEDDPPCARCGQPASVHCPLFGDDWHRQESCELVHHTFQERAALTGA